MTVKTGPFFCAAHRIAFEIELCSLTVTDSWPGANGKPSWEWNQEYIKDKGWELKVGMEPSWKAWKQLLGIVFPLKKKIINAVSLSAGCLSWDFCTASWMECGAKKMEKLNHQTLCHSSKITQEGNVMSELTNHRVVLASCSQLWPSDASLSLVHLKHELHDPGLSDHS